jgi:hypothetical protein
MKSPVHYFEEEDFGHGRIERQTCSVHRDLSFIENASMWTGFKGVVKIDSMPNGITIIFSKS